MCSVFGTPSSARTLCASHSSERPVLRRFRECAPEAGGDEARVAFAVRKGLLVEITRNQLRAAWREVDVRLAGRRLDAALVRVTDGLVLMPRQISGGADHPAHECNAARTGQCLDCLLDFARVDPLDLVPVEEVAHRAAMLGQDETVYIQAEPVPDRAPVADRHAVRLIPAGVALDAGRHEATIDPRISCDIADPGLHRSHVGDRLQRLASRQLPSNAVCKIAPAISRPRSSSPRSGSSPCGCRRGGRRRCRRRRYGDTGP